MAATLTSLRRRLTFVLPGPLFLCAALCLSAPSMVRAQGAASTGAAAVNVAPAGDVIGIGGSHMLLVSDLDKSISFYRDLLGVEPRNPPRPAVANPVVANLFHAPGALLRSASFPIPGSEMGIEMMEWTGIEHQSLQSRMHDPGATTVVLYVRDIAAAAAGLKTKGVTVVTPGGAPVALALPNGPVPTMVIKDPDGRPVQLMQRAAVPGSTAPADSNVIGAALRVAVTDLDRTMKFYRDTLGFEMGAAHVAGDNVWGPMLGLKGSEARLSSARVPGTSLSIEFAEFRRADGKPFKPSIHDIGASGLQVRVRDFDTTINRVKAGGGTIASLNGESVMFGTRLRVIFVADPDNVFFQIGQPLQAAPPAQR